MHIDLNIYSVVVLGTMAYCFYKHGRMVENHKWQAREQAIREENLRHLPKYDAPINNYNQR